MEAYQQAQSGDKEQVGESKAIPGSMRLLVATWRMSHQFRSLRAQSQTTYAHLLDKFVELHGDKSVRTAQPKHIRAILEAMSNTPAQANALRNVLRQLFQYAFENDWRPDNPVRDIKKLKYKKSPIPTWSEEDIEKFEQCWPIGTRARLALTLLLYTGQRRSDVIRMGVANVKDGAISVAQIKTDVRLLIPLHPDLHAVIRLLPENTAAFLMTQQGRAFASGNAFYNWFKECAVKAGIPSTLGPHGLRKAAARRMAEAGCTPHQIASITGHQTLAEVERYTKAVQQRLVAEQAVSMLGKPEKRLKAKKPV
ncbi:phage related integrase [Acetobacter orleanensis NRIC 0473]|uniref:Tyrosine recombinase n=2 Tax=Acetobacter orleanensis TaxID=104099 RepID=A0A4Y3TQ26_9PROT|nr:integrase [Acetobacter orleanensis JCM 7639]GBR27591.1 phage related integrase [Acetobacter orleanensis NRIC 0473]GEB83888.1 tyrosine recombinase [Acetobacter orleanensis]